MTKILIVDDNEREIRRPLVRQMGRIFGPDKILEAENGQQALELVEREHPMVILLDVMMPVMDGISACRLIRSKPQFSGLYIIMLTGREGGLAEGLDIGADAYVRKPYDIDELTAFVRKGLKQSKERSVPAMDPVTGLFNESFFLDSLLAGELARATRYELNFSLIRFRLDLPVSEAEPDDELLRAVSRLLSFRESDRVAYLGGHDFVVMLPSTPPAHALGIANRLCKRVAESDFPGHKPLTASFGVASFDFAEGLLMQLAEDALNQAQLQGGGMVRVAGA
ncbi:Protein-glutamate methylesterase/protein-glutamine glutaminase [Candidatus Magnetaquicoccaceae bacterium FCR-1]|uniref:Protein-glutamate methylesterase/protein-glutamine glutaminase n=1 Tax=Candidatus Magnetaquiglobus chichijimensis TaxID=3141448 RepID=A0ABQ0CAC9_9PROT